MNQQIPELLERFDWPVEAGRMFASALWGVLSCLFGYTILRVALLAWGLFMGVIGGVVVACVIADYRQIAAGPSGLDILIACSAGSLLLALASWIMYRLALGLAVGTAAGCVIAAQFGVPPTPVGWAAGALGGLALAAGLIIYTRLLVIFLSAVGGACSAVYWGAALVVQDESVLRASLTKSSPDVERIALLGGIAVALAGIGIFTQIRIRAFFLPAPAVPEPLADGGGGNGRRTSK